MSLSERFLQRSAQALHCTPRRGRAWPTKPLKRTPRVRRKAPESVRTRPTCPMCIPSRHAREMDYSTRIACCAGDLHTPFGRREEGTSTGIPAPQAWPAISAPYFGRCIDPREPELAACSALARRAADSCRRGVWLTRDPRSATGVDVARDRGVGGGGGIYRLRTGPCPRSWPWSWRTLWSGLAQGSCSVRWLRRGTGMITGSG